MCLNSSTDKQHHHFLHLLTQVISILGPGKFNSEKLCRSWSFEYIVLFLLHFKTCFINNIFPSAAISPVFFILFWFSLFPFSFYSFSCFDLLLFFFSHSSQPFLSGSVPFSSFLCQSVIISSFLTKLLCFTTALLHLVTQFLKHHAIRRISCRK